MEMNVCSRTFSKLKALLFLFAISILSIFHPSSANATTYNEGGDFFSNSGAGVLAFLEGAETEKEARNYGGPWKVISTGQPLQPSNEAVLAWNNRKANVGKADGFHIFKIYRKFGRIVEDRQINLVLRSREKWNFPGKCNVPESKATFTGLDKISKRSTHLSPFNGINQFVFENDANPLCDQSTAKFSTYLQAKAFGSDELKIAQFVEWISKPPQDVGQTKDWSLEVNAHPYKIYRDRTEDECNWKSDTRNAFIRYVVEGCSPYPYIGIESKGAELAIVEVRSTDGYRLQFKIDFSD